MKYLTIFIYFIPFFSLAAHHCLGNVVNIDVAANGNIHANITGVGDGNVLCSTRTKLGEYEPEACRAVLSSLLSAKMSNKKIRLYFRNDTNTSCYKGNWQNLGGAANQLYFVRLEG